MKEVFTLDWNEILETITNSGYTTTETFLIWYTFQALVHSMARAQWA